jgi:hypothetical protein
VAVRFEDRAQLGRDARELVAKLHTGEASFARFGETGFEAGFATNLDHVIIGPADGVCTDADHSSCSLEKT